MAVYRSSYFFKIRIHSMLTAYPITTRINACMLPQNPRDNFSIHLTAIQFSAHKKVTPTYPNVTWKDQ